MSTLWTIAANPRRRRRTARKGHRSAAQRAATRRMLAANRSRHVRVNPRRRRRATAVAAPVRHVRRRTHRTSARRSARRSGRISAAGMGRGAMALIKAGALGAAGALTVDVAMGFANGFLPASMATKLNADGSVNYMNYAAKGALAIGLAHFGKRFLGSKAELMAAGSFTVMAYELLRPMVAGVLPASMSLGYSAVRPGSVPSRMRSVGSYSDLGNYQRNVVPLTSPNAVAANSR